MANKAKISSINSTDESFIQEKDAIKVALSVQEFDKEFASIENVEELNEKLISYIERMIRSSFEYKQYIGYLKTDLDITKCSLIPSLDIKDFDFGLEFHHYPITLYDIVETHLIEALSTKKENEKVNLFDIMNNVMKEHYDGIIGLVPLSTTMHEMAHNDSVKIPITSVYGNYDKFIAKHTQYISENVKDKIQNAKLINKSDAALFNKKLEKNVLQYDVSYSKNKAD